MMGGSAKGDPKVRNANDEGRTLVGDAFARRAKDNISSFKVAAART